jgi:PAS domain S-box-containing protein
VSRTSLDEARAEFEAIFRAMQDTAVFADPQGRVRLSNAALERTFGFRRDDLRGRSLATLHADGQIGEGTDDRTVTTTYRRRDGSEFVGEGQRSLVRSETGAVIGQLEVVRDMTERLEAERALRQSELRYRGVLEAVPHLVWVTDPEGRHLYFNSGWYDVHRPVARGVMDYGFANALHPDDVPRTLAAWERSWRYLEPYDIEYRFRRHDGVYHWFVGRATPIRDAQGQVIEWVGTCTDIHDRFEFEQQLLGAEARSRGLLEGCRRSSGWPIRPDGPRGSTAASPSTPDPTAPRTARSSRCFTRTTAPRFVGAGTARSRAARPSRVSTVC